MARERQERTESSFQELGVTGSPGCRMGWLAPERIRRQARENRGLGLARRRFREFLRRQGVTGEIHLMVCTLGGDRKDFYTGVRREVLDGMPGDAPVCLGLYEGPPEAGTRLYWTRTSAGALRSSGSLSRTGDGRRYLIRIPLEEIRGKWNAGSGERGGGV